MLLDSWVFQDDFDIRIAYEQLLNCYKLVAN